MYDYRLKGAEIYDKEFCLNMKNPGLFYGSVSSAVHYMCIMADVLGLELPSGDSTAFSWIYVGSCNPPK